jgi:Cation efflux family
MSAPSASALHRHGRRIHEHRYVGAHRHPRLIRRSEPVEPDEHQHEHEHHVEHGHSHGLVDRAIVRSRAGLKAVSLSLGVLGATALVQAGILVLTGSVALLADLIHNVGDALTAVPLAIAFFLRSFRGEQLAGLAVVLAIFVSACVALYESIERLINPQDLSHLSVLAAAGGVLTTRTSPIAVCPSQPVKSSGPSVRRAWHLKTPHYWPAFS